MSQIESTTQPTIPPPGTESRRPLPRWAQVAVLLVVFAAGGAVGAMVATKVLHSKLQTYRENAPIFAEDIVTRLRIRLNLTDEQSEQVREIVERRHARMVEYRREGSLAMHTEFNAMEEEISDVLDDQQARQWREIANFVRERFLPPTMGRESTNPEVSPDNDVDPDDNDDQVSRDDMSEMPWFIKSIVFGGRESIPKDELANRLFNSRDENKDRQLAESELAGPLKKLVKSGDTNGDGVLSRDELISGI